MKPQKNVPLPRTNTLTADLIALKVGESLLFDFADGISARAIASRIAREMGRQYVSKREGQKIRVWRKA
jgi:hypothetical protein